MMPLHPIFEEALAPFTRPKPDTYRGWTIHYDPPPIPTRNFDWRATGPNYDASWEGEEDGWVDNGEKANAPTREKLIEAIDEWFEENGDGGTACIKVGATERGQ